MGISVFDSNYEVWCAMVSSQELRNDVDALMGSQKEYILKLQARLCYKTNPTPSRYSL